MSLHYFTDMTSGKREVSLHASFLVVPGISEGPRVSPIVREDVHLNETVCLGRGSSVAGMPGQQWGLPVHYFCGFSTDQRRGARGMYRAGRSASFACGLAELPQVDLFLTLEEGKSSLWVDYRSDLWKHLSGHGKLSLGATMLWAVADWSSAPSIWFDSAATGTRGSLNDFSGDEEDKGSTVAAVAKYNGLTKVLRQTREFAILPLEVVSRRYTAGVRARSWARMEDGELTLLAYRPPSMGETNELTSAVTDARLKRAVQANVPVVVAAKGSGEVARCGELAMVPYEGGETVIRRERGTRATVTSHYFGGRRSAGASDRRWRVEHTEKDGE